MPSAGAPAKAGQSYILVGRIDHTGIVACYFARRLLHPVVFFGVPLFDALHQAGRIPGKIFGPALYTVVF